MSDATIVATHASKWYGQVIALNDATVSIGPGITGLLGPNGAGKSTLMKLMVGQLRPSKGVLTIDGESIWNNQPLLRRIGYCPEHDSLYDELTALEFVATLTELHGFARGEAIERARRVLAAMDLAEVQERRLATFSKGMRQRTKLAQALAHDPEILFLDEPLTGCDPVARMKIIELVKARGKSGCCIVVSSHVLHEIEALTSEILLMHKGQVLADGNVHEIRNLIDRHPHRIRVECDRPRDLGRELAADSGVERIGFEESAVVVETRSPDRTYPLIPAAARRIGVQISALTSPDNNLQAVFQYLTEERR